MTRNRTLTFAVLLLILALFVVVPIVSASGLYQEADPIADLLAKLPPVSIGGIGLFSLVIGLVQVSKKIGLPSNYALPLAIVLVLLSYAALIAINVNPELERVIIGVLEILGTLISVIGGPKVLYHGYKLANVPGFAAKAKG
jgi:hypothetical protein